MTIDIFTLLEAPLPINAQPKIGLNPKGQDLSGKLRRYRSRGSNKESEIIVPSKELPIEVIKQVFTLLNPSIQSLERAARESTLYRETLNTLNSLDKTLPVNIEISLSYRNIDRCLKTIPDQSDQDIISYFFKSLTSKLRYIFSRQEDSAMFAPIKLQFPISHIPDIMEILPIFYKLDILLPTPIDPSVGYSSPKKYTVYGIGKIDKSHEIISNMFRTKKTNEEIEASKDKNYSLDNEDKVSIQNKISGIDQGIKTAESLPFDQYYEFIHLDNNIPDFTGPFLLKWN